MFVDLNSMTTLFFLFAYLFLSFCCCNGGCKEHRIYFAHYFNNGVN